MTLIKQAYRKTGARPIEVAGVRFFAYSVGILQYARISEDGRLWVARNHNADTYNACVFGLGYIMGAGGKSKRFRTEHAAMIAAIDAEAKQRTVEHIPFPGKSHFGG